MIFAFLVQPALAMDGEMQVCDAYSRMARTMGCDENNYLVAFGDRYCREFVRVNDRFTPYGQEVLSNIRRCLVKTLSSQKNLTCENVKTRAERNHVSCYKVHRFCTLDMPDRLRILGVLWTEIFDPGFNGVMFEILDECGVVST
ncbi:MAG: hypothetical protein HC902_00415 [Calothrix sp. SM1_5_4]|nr:hypothetical protein [Calothrix sp. SM1_5_4]